MNSSLRLATPTIFGSGRDALFFQQSCPGGWCHIEGGHIYLSKQAIASFIYADMGGELIC
jgi:hypothetical protein